MQMQKLLTFFSKQFSAYAIFNEQSFNDTLTNDIFSFELDPDVESIGYTLYQRVVRKKTQKKQQKKTR